MPSKSRKSRRAIPKQQVVLTPFARRLRELRAAKGVTQVEAAVAIGISRSALANLEVAGKLPGLATLEAIAGYYGVSLDYLTAREAADAEGKLDKESGRFLSTLGDRLQSARLASSPERQSVEAVAAALNVPPDLVEAWEANTALPELRHLVLLNLKLEIGADWLLNSDLRALPREVVQRIVNQGSWPGAPEASREVREVFRLLADEQLQRKRRTLHEPIALPPMRTITPPRE